MEDKLQDKANVDIINMQFKEIKRNMVERKSLIELDSEIKAMKLFSVDKNFVQEQINDLKKAMVK